MNAMARLDRVAELLAEIDELRAEIARLKDVCAPILQVVIPGVRLSRAEETILALLIKRDLVSREAAMYALYQDRDDAPAPKIIDVFICHIRRKLAASNIVIETTWGRGWSLPLSTRRAIEAGEPILPSDLAEALRDADALDGDPQGVEPAERSRGRRSSAFVWGGSWGRDATARRAHR